MISWRTFKIEKKDVERILNIEYQLNLNGERSRW